MIGRSRPAGRHRDGQAHTPVYRRVWDGPARAEAEVLGSISPGWSVLYSLSMRRFFGLCAWPSPQPVMISDATAEGLEQRMRETETLLILRMPLSESLGRAA
ncbi:hypothetical protein [Streptosporangium saharense]|uniref:Uncharacterized protein n=1 Tax=Streptosporangium saharense TaxID=1706840 RepID=A0A7W7QPT4_9ACTN|nr:hypothetical protein [Streptosporangium saharense]MBB4917541.1 hypothetical protein [Streptosporangium saharense]